MLGVIFLGKDIVVRRKFSFTKAMNKGIGSAKGDMVIALNNDVMV